MNASGPAARAGRSVPTPLTGSRRLARTIVAVALIAGGCGSSPDPAGPPTTASTPTTAPPATVTVEPAPASTAAPTTHPAYRPPDRCPDELNSKVEGDVDGDGRTDLVYNRQAPPLGDVYVGVCTAGGVVAEALIGGMGEVLLTLDIDLDGRDEILAGGTTMSAAIANVVLFAGDQLVVSEARVVDGFDSRNVGGDQVPALYQWGCADLTGDPGQELVQVVTWVDESLRWEQVVYSLGEIGVDPVLVTEGTFDLPVPDTSDQPIFPEPSSALRNALEELAPGC